MRLLSARLPVRIDLTHVKNQPVEAETSDAPAVEARENGLSRNQIVERILGMNPSATADFLARFDLSALAHYLDHLVAASMPRGRTARWIRPEGCCGVSWSVRRN